MSAKAFPADVVLSVYSGRFVTSSYNDVHELMDHFYPGIMTIGTAAMQPTASKELARQFPALEKTPAFHDPWEAWKAEALSVLPARFDVSGPHAVSDAEATAAFADFGRPGVLS